jgi:aspartyl/asparaginyl beta-hydroxylase (cupin superfamily)
MRYYDSRPVFFLVALLAADAFVLRRNSCRMPKSVGGNALLERVMDTEQAATTTAATPPLCTTPCASHTFAGMVEEGLRARFANNENTTDIDRVIHSWRLLDQGNTHTEQFPSAVDSGSYYQQVAHSYVPGLTVQPFWSTEQFPWVTKLEQQYAQIKKEFLKVTADTSLQEQGNNIWAGALTQDAAAYGPNWTTLVLMDRGRWDPVNVNLFPLTAKAVRDCGVHAVEVFFACMNANTTIQPHSDNTNFVLTSHLPLVVPYSGQNKCRLTVGDTTREWTNGNVLVFDTSLIHDAINESDERRYILMMRIWHPDLTDVEQKALQFTYDCLEFPELVSGTPEMQRKAHARAEQMRVFPTIQRAAGKTKGFGGGGGANKRMGKKA